jgi:RimJ/RimL family protein N-acetyltransferase
MSDIMFRAFDVGDPPRILQWYQKDRTGMESIMGQEIPDELACTLLINSLLQAASQGMALFYLIDVDSETIGFAGLTHMTPSKDFGQPHIYIEPTSRRFSVRAARAAESYASQIGIKNFMASIETHNKRGLALMKHLGYSEIPRKSFLKELSV